MKTKTTMVISVEIDTDIYDPLNGSMNEIMETIAEVVMATAPTGANVEHNITTATVTESN